jgi:hypothetical protein
MSTHFRNLDNELHSLINGIKSEPDPLLRLRYVKELEHKANKLLRELKWETAYAARQKYALRDISTVVDSDPGTVLYWSDQHRLAWGLPLIPRRASRDLSSYIDLTGKPASPPSLPVRSL